MSAPEPSVSPDEEEGSLGPHAFGPEEFARETGVSRETLARLKAYIGMLGDANAWHNLVSRRAAEMNDVWRRHVWDSAQMVPLVPRAAKSLIDIGSGAGFPGLVLAELLRDRTRVTLIESTAKKCRFLEAVTQRLALAVDVRNARAEAQPPQRFDVITARACAPLSRLLTYAQPFVGPNTVCLFLKGQNVGAELTEAHKSWTMKVREHQSLTFPSGRILEIRDLVRDRKSA
jgi:16S rRNA (guanine527-N7)-methyltransferase